MVDNFILVYRKCYYIQKVIKNLENLTTKKQPQTKSQRLPKKLEFGICFWEFLLRCCKSLFQIRDNIINMLNADAQAQQVLRHTCFGLLFDGHLSVRGIFTNRLNKPKAS